MGSHRNRLKPGGLGRGQLPLVTRDEDIRLPFEGASHVDRVHRAQHVLFEEINGFPDDGRREVADGGVADVAEESCS